MKTLVCVIAQTRGASLCWDSFNRHVLQELNADLCLAVAKQDHNSPYHKAAKYIFEFDELVSWSAVYNWMAKECGSTEDWESLSKIGSIWLGPINQPGSGAITHFYRWFLLRSLREAGLLDQYDRFLVTRSDFFYLCPMLPMDLTEVGKLYIPDGEDYGGVCDRQFIADRATTASVLSFAEDIVREPSELHEAMKSRNDWNPEQFMKLQLHRKGLYDSVRFYPYVMFTVREPHEGTRWSFGGYDPSVNMIVKYNSELTAARCSAERIKTKEDWRSRPMLADLYESARMTPSDINEHVATLHRYGSCCNHITEFGTRFGVSTCAFLFARPWRFVAYDINRQPQVDAYEQVAKIEKIDFAFKNEDTTKVTIEETDLLFIDTCHTYQQMRTELELHACKVRKYLICHDTELCGTVGEDGGRGIWMAITEYMRQHSEWRLSYHASNNCGLTIFSKA